jgi:prevent-host-death family protein
MLEFRRRAQRILAAVQRGERVLLTYRGRPIARIEPVGEATPAPDSDEPLLRLEEYAFDGPGGRITNADIDRLTYGEADLR